MEVTFYRWRKEYGGMSGDELRRLKETGGGARGLKVSPGGLRQYLLVQRQIGNRTA